MDSALSDDQLQAAMKLSRDNRAAAATLDRREARYLVDMYYSVQQYRIRAAGQIRAMKESSEPHSVLTHFLKSYEILERQAKGALQRFAESDPVGQWALSVTGIGPVIAAGMLAHIDIERAPYMGSVWTYAGLNPERKWHGAKDSRELVKAAFTIAEDDVQAVVHLADESNRRVDDLYEKALEVFKDEDEYRDALASFTDESKVRDLWLKCRIERSAYLGNAYDLALEKLGVDRVEGYRALFGGDDVDRETLIKYLSRRSWNNDLKVLCWKAGESFVKVKNRESDYYGKIYDSRKTLLNEKNDRMEFKDAAEYKLANVNIGKSTEAYQWYAAGKLPPGHINERAKRYAVKMFLAHLWEVMYVVEYGIPAPDPYVIAHGNHTRKLPPPNFDQSKWLKGAA